MIDVSDAISEYLAGGETFGDLARVMRATTLFAHQLMLRQRNRRLALLPTNRRRDPTAKSERDGAMGMLFKSSSDVSPKSGSGGQRVDRHRWGRCASRRESAPVGHPLCAAAQLAAAMWPPVLALLFHQLVFADAQGILGFLNLGNSGTSRSSAARSPTITDFTSQGLGLLNYFTSLQRNPIGSAPGRAKEVNLLGLEGVKGAPDLVGLPNANFLQGVPVVPGVAGSVPGVGECLPRGLPFFSQKSPSMFQNILRNIPGASDVLKSLAPVPDVDAHGLMGKWHWVSVLLRVLFENYSERVILRLSSRRRFILASARPLNVSVAVPNYLSARSRRPTEPRIAFLCC